MRKDPGQMREDVICNEYNKYTENVIKIYGALIN